MKYDCYILSCIKTSYKLKVKGILNILKKRYNLYPMTHSTPNLQCTKHPSPMRMLLPGPIQSEELKSWK